jgi:hypothetical protein
MTSLVLGVILVIAFCRFTIKKRREERPPMFALELPSLGDFQVSHQRIYNKGKKG